MRQLKKYNIIQKIIALLAILCTMSSVMIVKPVYADEGPTEEDKHEGEASFSIADFLIDPLTGILCILGDSINGILQTFFIGKGASDVLLSPKLISFWHNPMEEFVSDEENMVRDGLPTQYIVKDNVYWGIIEGWTDSYYIPYFQLTPAEIFAGNIAALDANFFKTDYAVDDELGGKEKSIVADLKATVSKWYVALRNISIVGLLSVLLYIGIRIVISSGVGDKAKYKQFFTDWVVALCLIFFLHYIMAFTMTMSETITDVLSGSSSSNGQIKQLNIKYIDKNGDPYYDRDGAHVFGVAVGSKFNIEFASNFTGLARIKAQYNDNVLRIGYTVLYLALTFYTAYFAYIYLKRLLFLAFFTIVAPLVALTYPLDKMKDSSAQAFNYWLKEYMFYALLQPLHMLLYTVFVSSALSVASNNLLYAIVVMACIVPAEKIAKEMFGINGHTGSNLGGFAGGALAAKAFSALKSPSKPKKGGNQEANNNKIRQAKNPNAPNAMDTLSDDASNIDQTKLPPGAGAVMDDEEADEGKQSASVSQQNTGGQGDAGKNEAQQEKLHGGQKTINTINNEPAENQEDTLGTDDNGSNNHRQSKFTTNPTTPSNLNNNQQRKGGKESKKKGRLANNFNRAVKKRYLAAGGAKGVAKGLAKGVAKGYVRALGTAGMGLIGLSAGMVGGDVSDTLKGLGAGLVAGDAVSKKANQMAGNFLPRVRNSAVGRFADDVFNGDDEARKKQFIKQYMRDSETSSRILEKHPEMKIKEVRARQEAEAKMMYDTGIDDYSTISRAVDLEKELAKENAAKNKGKDPEDRIPDNSHDMAMSIAKLSQNYDNSTFTDYNKTQAAQRSLQKKLAKQMQARTNIEEQAEQELQIKEQESKKKMGDKEREEAKQKIIAEKNAQISKQAGAEATQTLERIREIKKL